MADITVTAAQVARLRPDIDVVETGIAAATITAGQSLYRNSSNKVDLGDGNGSATTADVIGIALEGASAGQPVDYLSYGPLAGFTLSTVDMLLYQSDTAGALADAAGSISKTIGRAVSHNEAGGSFTNVLWVDIPKS